MSKYLMKYLFVSVIMLLFLTGNSRNVDRKHWKQTKEGLNYERGGDASSSLENVDWWDRMWERNISKNGHRTPNTKEYEELRQKERERKKIKNNLQEYNFPQWLIVLLFVVVGIVLAFVVYYLFFKAEVKIAKNVAIVQEEELPVHKTIDELENALKGYLAEENYREAIRVYFIFIIKALRDKEWILWESKKTNHAYLFEIRHRKQYEAFSEVVLLFEIIWFGKREITREQYELLQPKFKNLLNAIKSSNE